VAQYNADLRIGITGKTQLNALEKQLGRINKDLTKINKGLKAQTLTINTKGATRALDQLDRKINKLNRTINVNANINEKTDRSSSGGGTLFVSNGAAQQLAVAKAAQPIAKALTNEAQDLLDAEVARNKAIGETVELREKINDQIEKQRKLERNINTVENSSNEKARTANMNRLFGGNVSKAGNKLSPKQSLALAKQESDRLTASTSRLGKAFQDSRTQVVETSKSYQKLAGDAKRAAAAETEATASAVKNAAARKRFNKGFGTGAGIAGASALGGIPVLGDAVTGGLAAGLSGGSVAAGALGGALVGIGVAAAGAIAEVTKFNNALTLQQKALANTVATADELEAALAAIENVSKDFVVPIGDATAQFTKLNAAARASGFGVGEVEEVYRGLAAANVALGGDAERLNGILLATQQVFSKGKVQAEELRGQIGERLAGAFAKFAESAGLSTSELDKALEKGEVSLEDFVRFSKSLLEEYEEDAKKLADAPENAAARLKLAIDDLKRSLGPALQGLGNFFIEFATKAVNALNAVVGAAYKLPLAIAQAQYSEAESEYLEQLRDPAMFGQDLLLERRKANLDRATKNLEEKTKAFEATQTKLKATGSTLPEKPKTGLDEDEPKGGGGGGKTARDSRAGQMQRDLELSLAQNKLAESTLGIYGRELEQLELVNRETEARLTYKKELADIAADDLYADEKAIAIQQAQADLDKKLIDLAGDRLAIENEIDKAKKEGLKPLEQEKAVLEALVNKGPEAAEQVRLQQQAADIAEGLGDEYYQQVLDLLKGNAALRKRQELLQEQREMWNQIGQAVGQAIEDTLVNGIAAAVSEAEKLSDVLSDIARQLLSTVGRILINAAINQAAGPGGLFGKQGLPGFKAEGGPINAGMPYIVGEKGPELVIPGAAGTVIPNDAFSAATQALQSNGRGTAAGVDGTASQGEAFAVANGARSISTETSRNTSTMNQIREYEERVINNPEPLKVDYQSTVINNQTYVTEEQFQKGLTQSSNRARQATIRDLRNNPASRKMAGVNR
jgi:tape measure domain-containing protein